MAATAQGDRARDYSRSNHHKPAQSTGTAERQKPRGWLHGVGRGRSRSMGISVSVVEILNPTEIEEKISGLKPHQGVIFPPNSFIAAHRARIIGLLTRFRVPGVYFKNFLLGLSLTTSEPEADERWKHILPPLNLKTARSWRGTVPLRTSRGRGV